MLPGLDSDSESSFFEVPSPLSLFGPANGGRDAQEESPATTSPREESSAEVSTPSEGTDAVKAPPPHERDGPARTPGKGSKQGTRRSSGMRKLPRPRTLPRQHPQNTSRDHPAPPPQLLPTTSRMWTWPARASTPRSAA